MTTARIRRMLQEIHVAPSPWWVAWIASLGEDERAKPPRDEPPPHGEEARLSPYA